MAAPAFIPSTYCHNCGRDRLRIDSRTSPSTGVHWCARCWEWHRQALLAFAGQPPTGCQMCNRTYQQLEEVSPNHDVRFKIVRRDGLFQVHCLPCAAKYSQAARHQYKGLKVAHDRKMF